MKDKFVRYFIPLLLFSAFVSISWAQEQALPELSLTKVSDIEVPQGFTEGLKEGSLVSTNSSLWLVAGCLFPLPGVIASAAYSPRFNPEELQRIAEVKGQSYALGYAKAYETNARNNNYQAAWNGFGIALAIVSILNSLSGLAGSASMASPDGMASSPVPLMKELRYDTR